MVHRDPESGKFVAGSDNQYQYGDLDIQHIFHSFSVAAAEVDGTTGQGGGQTFVGEQALVAEPAGGLPRNAVAELVSMDVSVVAYINSSQTEDGTVQGLLELSTEGNSQVVESLNSNVDVNNTAGAVDIIDVSSTTDSDVIGMLQAVGHGPITDTVNGLAGAGSAGEAELSIDFRNKFGTGPLFERDDEVTGHLGLKQWNVADSALHLDMAAQLLWDVHVD